jgi:DNA primase
VEVLERESVELKRRGKDLWGCCPLHKERTPSFKVNVERQKFYCFGCHRYGDVIDFVMLVYQTRLNHSRVGRPPFFSHIFTFHHRLLLRV